MRKRARKSSDVLFDIFIATSGDEEWRARIEAKAKRVGVVVSQFSKKEGTACVRRLVYVGSYHHEWIDKELDAALQAGAELVTEEFLDVAMTDAKVSIVDICFGGSLVNKPQLLPHNRDEERPFPQTLKEFLEMAERRQLGDDEGDSIFLVDMTRNGKDGTDLQRALVWFSAFFCPIRVEILNKKLPPPKKTLRVSYSLLLEKIWKEKARDKRCFAMVGITDVDIFDDETKDVIYGRATGDGGGVISTFHFKNSFRCFLSTAAHETLHTFGLDHCDYFACLMNPSCDAEVEESIHMFLCPLCEVKLQRCIEFDKAGRRAQLYAACQKLGLADDMLHFTNELERSNIALHECSSSKSVLVQN